jgi:hypothetical protein
MADLRLKSRHDRNKNRLFQDHDMPTKSTAGAALALLALSLSASLNAQQAAPAPGGAEPSRQTAAAQNAATQQSGLLPSEEAGKLEAESRQAYEDGEYLRFYIANMKLHKMLPYVPQYMYNIVRACALLEKPNTAYHYMLKMQQQGLAYNFNETEDSQNIRNTQAYDYINNMMIEAGNPAGDGTVAMTLAGDPADFQAIAWDASRDRLLVGTLNEGTVLAADANGNSEVMLQADSENGLWSVNGLAVDPGNNRLWVSSSSTPRFAAHSDADGNRNALFEFELDSLGLVARHDLPNDTLYHELGGISVSDDGHVYVVDNVMPVIYRKRPQQAGLEPFVGSRGLVAFTDVAVTPDNSRLYASDPATGIFTVDLTAESATMVSGPETLNLAGIQSLEYVDDKLFIVQAGFRPERVMRLELEPNRLAVANVVPMAIALEAFDWPGAGTVADTDIYYFANAGAGEGAAGSVIMRTRLDAGSATNAIDIEDLQNMLKPQDQ